MSYFADWSELTRQVIEGVGREKAVEEMDARFLADAKANIDHRRLSSAREILEMMEAEES